MDLFTMLVQAIIQGLTEFLPVSSSGHLSIVQHFMNVGEESLAISIVLHLGTLLAVIAAFAPTIGRMIKEFFLTIRDIFTGNFSWQRMNGDRRMMIMVIISTLILVPAYFFRDYFVGMSGDGDIIFEGAAFIFTALLLFLSDACIKGYKTGDNLTVKDAIIVGLFQCVALFPGVSRSGSTISAGLFCGFSRETAITYAFILGIPAILGGSVLELGRIAEAETTALNLPLLAIGFSVAAIVGFLAIKLIKLILKHDKFKIFGIYTLLLGIACVAVGLYETLSGTHFSIKF